MVTLQRYGAMYHDLGTWLVSAGLPPMSVLAGGDVGLVNEILTSYLQHICNEELPFSRASFTFQYFHRRLCGAASRSVVGCQNVEDGRARRTTVADPGIGALGADGDSAGAGGSSVGSVARGGLPRLAETGRSMPAAPRT